MLAETSRKAYAAVKKVLGERQQQVLDAIEEEGSASNEMLSEKLRLPINYITPRVNELVRYGYAAPVGITTNRSGMSAKLWAVVDPQDKKIKELDCEA